MNMQKVKVAINQAECVRRGIAAPSSTGFVEVDLDHLDSDQRNALADRLGYDCIRLTVDTPDEFGVIAALDKIVAAEKKERADTAERNAAMLKQLEEMNFEAEVKFMQTPDVEGYMAPLTYREFNRYIAPYSFEWASTVDAEKTRAIEKKYKELTAECQESKNKAYEVYESAVKRKRDLDKQALESNVARAIHDWAPTNTQQLHELGLLDEPATVACHTLAFEIAREGRLVKWWDKTWFNESNTTFVSVGNVGIDPALSEGYFEAVRAIDDLTKPKEEGVNIALYGQYKKSIELVTVSDVDSDNKVQFFVVSFWLFGVWSKEMRVHHGYVYDGKGRKIIEKVDAPVAKRAEGRDCPLCHSWIEDEEGA